MEEKLDFEKEMKRLDEIVNKISSQNVSLDESLVLYQEGQAIIKKLEKGLEEAQNKGYIKELELQKIFEIQPKYINNKGEHIRAITYKADFVYFDVKKDRFIVEDVKGYKTDVYKLKKKLFEYVYPNLTIEEI